MYMETLADKKRYLSGEFFKKMPLLDRTDTTTGECVVEFWGVAYEKGYATLAPEFSEEQDCERFLRFVEMLMFLNIVLRFDRFLMRLEKRFLFQ